MISFHSNQSSQINWLSKNIKPNRLSPLLHYLSATSSLLRLSPSLLPHVIPTCLMVSLLTSSVATSLVPLQKPVKMSPLWRDETPASFTPDVMQSEIRSPIAFLTDVNVTTCFQHRPFNITRRRSPVHSIQLINTHLNESLFALFLIVHHKECFHLSQHKVVCKLLLIPTCRDGSPFLLLLT